MNIYIKLDWQLYKDKLILVEHSILVQILAGRKIFMIFIISEQCNRNFDQAYFELK